MTPRLNMTCLIAVAALVASSAGATTCDWTVIDAPTPNDRSLLFDVAFLGPDEAWAVGRRDDSYDTFSFDQLTLALRWDGSAWTQVPTPSPGLFLGGGTDAFLNAVEAIASDDVWAAGTYFTVGADGFAGFQSLALHWDGSSWTQSETPLTPPGGTGATIRDLMSFGPSDVWAVGSRVASEYGSTDEVSLALHWDGSAWTELPHAAIVDEHQGFRAIGGTGTDNLWAVGGRGGTAAKDHSYVARWDGSEWAVDPSVPDVGVQSFLLDVAVLAADDIWIVGQENLVGPGTRPLFLHYDGARWTQVVADSFIHFSGRLEAVTAIASDDIWAVGTSATFDGDPARPLIMHWDGDAWTEVPAAADGPEFGWFRGVDATSGCEVVAVGQKSPGLETLVQHTVSAGVTGDLDGDGSVGPADLGILLSTWGACDDPAGCPADLTGDGAVTSRDLGQLLAAWG